MEEQVINLEELLDAIKGRWKLIAITTLVAIVLATVVSFFLITPKYEVSTKVFIGKEDSKESSYNNSDIQMYQNLMKTYAETIKTKDLIGKSLKGIDTELTTEEVLAVITINPVPNTQILEIKLEGEDKEESARILKSVTKEFIAKSKELVPNGNVRILEEVDIPDHPVSPNKKMNIVIAALLGLMGSIGVVFLLEFLDNTFKTKDSLEKEFDIPVLGVIPKLDEK